MLTLEKESYEVAALKMIPGIHMMRFVTVAWIFPLTERILQTIRRIGLDVQLNALLIV